MLKMLGYLSVVTIRLIMSAFGAEAGDPAPVLRFHNALKLASEMGVCQTLRLRVRQCRVGPAW